jgi:hypothetical protein
MVDLVSGRQAAPDDVTAFRDQVLYAAGITAVGRAAKVGSVTRCEGPAL